MDITERRNRIRSKTLGAPTQYKHLGVEIDGEFIAVREPTVRERADVTKAALGDSGANGKVEFDLGTQQVMAVVACAFVADPVMEPDPTAPTSLDGQPAMRVKTERLPELDGQGRPVMEDALDAEGKPTIGEDGKPAKREKLKTYPVVTSGFTPAERLYANSDMAVLFGKPVSGFMNALIPAAMKLFNPREEDARKSS